jgi:hypothetical protein
MQIKETIGASFPGSVESPPQEEDVVVLVDGAGVTLRVKRVEGMPEEVLSQPSPRTSRQRPRAAAPTSGSPRSSASPKDEAARSV